MVKPVCPARVRPGRIVSALRPMSDGRRAAKRTSGLASNSQPTIKARRLGSAPGQFPAKHQSPSKALTARIPFGRLSASPVSNLGHDFRITSNGWGICPSSLWGVAHGKLAAQSSRTFCLGRRVCGSDGIHHHFCSGRKIRPLTDIRGVCQCIQKTVS